MPVPDADIATLAKRQRAAFATGRTRDVDARLDGLRRLRRAVERNEARLLGALASDLGKPTLEALGSDVVPLLSELDSLIRNARRWSRPRFVGSPLLTPGWSRIQPDPYGAVLVMSPWNYPLQLALVPAAGAIAAGNCVTLKPSELAPATGELIAEMVEACFEPEVFSVVSGGVAHAQALLGQRWDYLFFTGGTQIGRIVMGAAAEHLTPVTLELGGKNPCIVSQHADVVAAAKRIAWGKFFNAGQTCIAPDYLLVHASVHERFIAELSSAVVRFYGTDPIDSPDYARVVNEPHLERLTRMLEGEQVVLGGHADPKGRYLAPTIVDGVSWDSPLMAEEIFGPVLPVLVYDDFAETVRHVEALPKPLTAYLFSRDRAEKRRMLDVGAGAVVLNDTLLHFTNASLPFGGVGASGMGAYHGRRTLTTFTHDKAVLSHRGWPRLLGVRWPPYRLPLWMVRSLRWFG